MLGHQSLKTTQIYAKVLPENNYVVFSANDVLKMGKRLIMPLKIRGYNSINKYKNG